MEKAKTWTILILVTAVIVLGAILNLQKPKVEVVESQIIITDTIVARDTVFLRYDKYITDTDTVEVPIYKHTFDTIIKEVHIGGSFEGFHAQIDSLFIEVPMFKERKQKKWSVGPNIGVGVGIKGVSPFVGVGVTYSLYSF